MFEGLLRVKLLVVMLIQSKGAVTFTQILQDNGDALTLFSVDRHNPEDNTMTCSSLLSIPVHELSMESSWTLQTMRRRMSVAPDFTAPPCL